MMEKNNKIMKLITIIAVLYLLSTIITALIGEETRTGNVAVISIKGTIMSDDNQGLITSKVASATRIIREIEQANKDKKTKAIVLEINSGGGSPVASDEIARAIKKSNKTTIAWIREAGASGAYWIASATDHIIAHPLSITGSIGVIGSYLDFSGLLNKYNITYQRLVAGKYKDAGTPFKELTPEEKKILEEKINIIYDAFIREIAKNRNMSYEKVKEEANGMFMLGEEAYKKGFIDELGSKEEVKKYLEKKLNMSIKFYYFKKELSLTDLLATISEKHGYAIGEGIGSKITSKEVISKITT